MEMGREVGFSEGSRFHCRSRGLSLLLPLLLLPFALWEGRVVGRLLR